LRVGAAELAGNRLRRVDEHAGDESLRKIIEKFQPLLVVCGHIHEAAGLERFAGTWCLNAGALGGPWAQTIAWEVAWEKDVSGYRFVGHLSLLADLYALNRGQGE
jgi:Icc-related predicted phosphoesterase